LPGRATRRKGILSEKRRKRSSIKEVIGKFEGKYP